MFHKSSTSFILSALAFFDFSTVNVILVYLWLIIRFGINIERFTSFGCKFRGMLAYYTQHVSGILMKLLSTRGIVSLRLPRCYFGTMMMLIATNYFSV